MADDKKRDDGAYEMPERNGMSTFDAQTRGPAPAPATSAPSSLGAVSNNPVVPVLAYCGSSILMTVTNKYVLSGTGFNLNFFLLAVQVVHCPAKALFH